MTEVVTAEYKSRCSLCRQEYTDPRLLRCFHSFCGECLNQRVETKENTELVSCPICHTEMSPTPEDVSLQVNSSNYVTKEAACDICNNNTATSRCIECTDNFCDSCLIFHQKISCTKKHHIAVLNGSGSGLPKIIRRVYCKKHKNEELRFYCLVCSELVCRDCKLTEHENHISKDIVETADTTRKEIKLKADDLYDTLQVLSESEGHVSDYTNILQLKTDKNITAIQERAALLHQEIDKISHRITTELKTKHAMELGRLASYEKTVQDNIVSVSSRLYSAEHVLVNADDVDILKLGKELCNILEEESVRSASNAEFEETNAKFEIREMDFRSLESFFGYWARRPSLVSFPRTVSVQQNPYPEIEVVLLDSFPCQDKPGNIHAIAPISPQEAWVSWGWGNNELQLFSRSGQRKKIVSLDIQVDDVCAVPDGSVLVSSYKGTTLKRMDSNMEITNYKALTVVPRGLTVTSNGDVIFAAVENHYTGTGGSRSPRGQRHMLMRLSTDGEILQEIQTDGHDPYRVAENMNGDICFSDYGVSGKRQVVILDSEGNLKTTYLGPLGMSNGLSFYPLGICCDQYGHIIVVDWNNNSVHLLDRHGRFLRYLLTDQDGVDNPSAVAVDESGCLWVGDASATIRVFRYIKQNKDETEN